MQYSQENTCAGPGRASFTEHLSWRAFRGANSFFQVNLVFIADRHIGNTTGTPSKTRLKPQMQPLELFCKKGVLRNFADFTGKHLCWSFFLTELQEVCNFIKKRLRHRSFPEEFTKLLRTPNLKTVNDCFWNLLFNLSCPF